MNQLFLINRCVTSLILVCSIQNMYPFKLVVAIETKPIKSIAYKWKHVNINLWCSWNQICIINITVILYYTYLIVITCSIYISLSGTSYRKIFSNCYFILYTYPRETYLQKTLPGHLTLYWLLPWSARSYRTWQVWSFSGCCCCWSILWVFSLGLPLQRGQTQGFLAHHSPGLATSMTVCWYHLPFWKALMAKSTPSHPHQACGEQVQ